ncbi:phosphoribosylaminoimidazole-succinocarboxamide synthase [Diutina catenulata]
MSVTTTDLHGALPLIARGKVRDIYQVDDNTLLFVATDRISAYDVIMTNGIPNKGKILTKLSEYWFSVLPFPNHLASSSDEVMSKLPESVQQYADQLEGRSLLVRKLRLVPLEVIVRGYITGSAWKEYQEKGTIHGQKMPAGLQESEAFPHPIFTPSTKAEQGEHDENISRDQAAEIVGAELCDKLASAAVDLYSQAADLAKKNGIIIADTKFEFGLDDNGELVLVDEVLTPDSSRFWSGAEYKVGQGQDSYDKQYLRDWLTREGLKGKEGVAMTPEIAEASKQKYVEAYEAITGKKWAD